MFEINKVNKNALSCVGSGLIALDVIVNGNPSTPAKLCAGGSCGNVLAILAFLGWNSSPVARLSKNKASENLLSDFSNFNINTSLISCTDDGATPIIIHRILKDKEGNPKHKFEFRIPKTNVWLPSFKPVLASAVDEIISKQASSDVYYFDRISRSAINLAKYYKSTGALIVFEPSSYSDNKQFLECIQLADIFKFSDDRISNFSELFPNPVCPLEIVTHGKQGLQYRMKFQKDTNWVKIPSFKFDNIIDGAGAGDWCTAGIINELGINGSMSFNNASRDDIERALKIGQLFGGINCIFDGARGIAYNLTYDSFIRVAEGLINNENIQIPSQEKGVDIITIPDFAFESIL